MTGDGIRQHRRMRSTRYVLVALAVAAAGCAGGNDPTVSAAPDDSTTTTTPTGDAVTTAPLEDPLGGFVSAPIEWEGCGDGRQCATVPVPLDWSDPAGPTIGIAVARIPAADDRSPPGFLAYNLGGPGADGVSSVGLSIFGSQVRNRFDIFSWDPRGIGLSAPLECGDAVEPFLDADPHPDDDAERALLDDAATAVAEECGTEDGDLLPHMGTDDVARDLEAIRRAYGEPMSYVGFSYGTLIGLRYAELFPQGAEAVVLDGVVDPEHSLTDLLRGQAVAFEDVIAEAFAGCPDGGEGCPDGGAAAAFDRLAVAVEDHSIPSSRGEDLGPSELSRGTLYAGYDEAIWPELYEGLAAAESGDGSILASLAAAYDSLTAFTPYQAVSCLDSVNPMGSDGWAAFAAEMARLSPRFGAAIANEMLPCAFWPVVANPVTGPVAAEGSPPILVIGTTGDAATPLAQAERVAANLADGHLLVYDGEAHTAYGRTACIDDLVDAYLLNGALPPEGTVC